MSLWKVDDKATAALMKLFYEHLLRGRSPAQAMRSAAEEMRAAHAHPFFWAPFIVSGRTGRVSALHAGQ